MANSVRYYLEQIKKEGELHDLLIKAQSVECTYNGETMTLAAALTAIFGDVSALPTTTAMNAAISTAISQSGHAHFEKVAAVPAVADAVENVMYLVPNATTGHLDIYAKIKGEGDSYTMEQLDDTTVDLTGLIEKVTGATAGHVPTLTAEGGIADTGKQIGGATLSGTPNADTLATEAAVSAAIAGQATATQGAKGLMSAADKTRMDNAGAVWIGESAPAAMRDGDLFIRVVAEVSGD